MLPNRFVFLALGCLLPLPSQTLRAAPLPDLPFEAALEALADPSPQVRQAASNQLRAAGPLALRALHQTAAKHPSLLLRQRAGEVLQSLARGELLVSGDGSSYWLNRCLFLPGTSAALVTGGGLMWRDLNDGTELRRVLELQFARPALALSPNGRLAATGHQSDTWVRLVEVESGKVARTLQGHALGVYAVQFTTDGQRLLSGSNDGTVRLWDLGTGAPQRILNAAQGPVRSLSLATDNKSLLVGHAGKFAVVQWDLDTGRLVRLLTGHAKEVTAVHVLPGGTRAVSAGMDGRVVLWDLAAGKEMLRWEHKGGVHSAAVNPTGKRLLTAGFGDQTARLWDLDTGKELARLEGHGAAALGVAFSPSGRLALTTDARCTLRLWRLAVE